MVSFCSALLHTTKKKKSYVKVGVPHFELRIYMSMFFGGSLPGSPMVKNLPANAGDAGDLGSISGLGRSPGGGNGNLLQYSCLENSMDRGAWWVNVHWVTKSWTRLSDSVSQSVQSPSRVSLRPHGLSTEKYILESIHYSILFASMMLLCPCEGSSFGA